MGRGRVWTPEQRAAVVAEYESAPHGRKKDVLRKHKVGATQLRRWREPNQQNRPSRSNRPRVHRTPEQQAAIVAAYDAAPYGKKGRVLRKHRITTGQISTWRVKAGETLPPIVVDYDPAPTSEKPASGLISEMGADIAEALRREAAAHEERAVQCRTAADALDALNA